MAAHRRPFPVCDTFTMITCAAIGMGGGPIPQPWRLIGGSRGARRGRAQISASVRHLGSLQVGATAGCQRRSPGGMVSERLCPPAEPGVLRSPTVTTEQAPALLLADPSGHNGSRVPRHVGMRLPASHDAVIIASRSACTNQRLRLLSCVYAQPTTSSPITTTAPIGSSPAPPMLSGVEVDAAWIALREHQSYLVRSGRWCRPPRSKTGPDVAASGWSEKLSRRKP
jgi:hypothetical protein